LFVIAFVIVFPRARRPVVVVSGWQWPGPGNYAARHHIKG
jgi:hypothetical protein